MHYPCGVGHIGAVRECWHEGSRSGYILCVLLQETNHIKHIMKSLIVGTTSLYIGRERNCATDCSRIPYFLVLVWVRNARTWHASCILHTPVVVVLLLWLRFTKIYLVHHVFTMSSLKILFVLRCQIKSVFLKTVAYVSTMCSYRWLASRT